MFQSSILPRRSGVDLDLGAWYKIGAPDIESAWIRINGVRTAVSSSDVRFCGRLVSRDEDFENGRVTVGVLLENVENAAFIRWRAPAAVVASVLINDITIEENAFHDAPNADVDYFSVGDIVEFHYPDGSLLNGSGSYETLEITGITGNIVTLDSAPATDPTGYIMRLTRYDQYGNGAEPVSGAGRAYVFIGDTTSGDLDGDTPDIYG